MCCAVSLLAPLFSRPLSVYSSIAVPCLSHCRCCRPLFVALPSRRVPSWAAFFAGPCSWYFRALHHEHAQRNAVPEVLQPSSEAVSHPQTLLQITAALRHPVRGPGKHRGQNGSKAVNIIGTPLSERHQRLTSSEPSSVLLCHLMKPPHGEGSVPTRDGVACFGSVARVVTGSRLQVPLGM